MNNPVNCSYMTSLWWRARTDEPDGQREHDVGVDPPDLGHTGAVILLTPPLLSY